MENVQQGCLIYRGNLFFIILRICRALYVGIAVFQASFKLCIITDFIAPFFLAPGVVSVLLCKIDANSEQSRIVTTEP